MIILDYNIDGRKIEYPVADSKIRKFLEQELSKEEVAETYIDNYYPEETQDGLAELAEMYPEGVTVDSIKADADGWILDVLVQNAYDFYNDNNWRELMLSYFYDDAIAYNS